MMCRTDSQWMYLAALVVSLTLHVLPQGVGAVFGIEHYVQAEHSC